MKFIFLVTMGLAATSALAQIQPNVARPNAVRPNRVTIARDTFGVPHIFAKTDAEVSYGLAWAHAEDDFKTLQLPLLAAKGLLGRHLGKRGAVADYVVELLRAPEVVAEKLPTVSPNFRAVLEGYLQGLNDFARTHPQEVLVKGAFPITLTDYFKATVLSMSSISGVDRALQDILGERVPTVDFLKATGSNAIAIHRKKTTEGQTLLAINSHQPLEGPVAWYEAHLCSEEGWNALGGLFPGGATIHHGVNEHLGWAHTVNYPDKIDVYQLETDAAHPGQYKFDGQWLPLEEKRVKLRIKGLPFTVGRKAYWSKYGATLRTKRGWFALRTAANMDIGAVEQWYRMNKARNFSEFRRALEPMGLGTFNIIYADRDTIFYVSNAKLPRRDPAYNWQTTLPGNTSRTLWTQFHPFSALPQYLNPPGGYVYNTNNTPFHATAPADTLDPARFDPTMGIERWDNNRSTRLSTLLQKTAPAPADRFSYDDFKRIKYDRQLPERLHYVGGPDANALFSLKSADFPDVADYVTLLTNWNRQAAPESRAAAVFLLFYRYWKDKAGSLATPTAVLTAAQCAEGLRAAKAHLQKHFGRTDVTLGELQRHTRGAVDLPIGGIPDVLAAMDSQERPDGRLRAQQGDSYIMLVRFPQNGSLPLLETVNAYGASNHSDSPHYTDQMLMFVNQQTKPMTLDKAAVLRSARRVYHPGE